MLVNVNLGLVSIDQIKLVVNVNLSRVSIDHYKLSIDINLDNVSTFDCYHLSIDQYQLRSPNY